jgi:hypothetical protein
MPRRSSEHPSEGRLRAYLDGELASEATLECAAHLRHCLICRHALHDVEARGEVVGDLLTVALASRRPDRRTVFVRSAIGLAAAGLVAAVATGVARWHEPATHTRTAGATHVQDVCCFNLDGGSRRDDGMLTVSRADQIVDCVVLYEDRAGTRVFSPRDPLRFISQPDGCTTDVIAAVSADLLLSAGS